MRINMKRRQFLTLSAIAIAAPATGLAQEGNVVDYTRESYEKALASGEPFMLDFYATW